MEKMEQCETDSNSSANTSLSYLSTYGDEFLSLKNLTKASNSLGSINSWLKSKNGDGDRGKSNAPCAECKLSIDKVQNETKIRFYDKINTLLARNRQLEVQIETCNSQLYRLINNDYSGQANSDQNYVLEKEIHFLNSKIVLLENDLLKYKSSILQNEIESNNFDTDLKTLRNDLLAKDRCVKELKDNVSSQCVQILNLSRSHMQCSNNIKVLNGQLEQSNASESWLKEQMDSLRENKKCLTNNLIEEKKKTLESMKQNENLLLQLDRWKKQYEAVNFEMLKQKHSFMRNEEIYKSKMLEFETSNNNINKLPNNFSMDNISIKNHYELIINDLNQEISNLRKNLEETQEESQKTFRENALLISKCVVMQKSLEQKEIVNEETELNAKQLLLKNDYLTEKLLQKEKDLEEARNLNVSLKVEILAKNQYNEEIQRNIEIIKTRVNILKESYEKQREELQEKNRQILALETEKHKQFMSNNWRTCQAENLDKKEKEMIVLTNKMATMDKNHAELECAFVKYKETSETVIEDLRKEIKKYKDKSEESEKESMDFDKIVLEHKMQVSKYENEINTMKRNLNEKNLEIGRLHNSKINEKTEENYYSDNELKLMEHVCKLCRLENTVILREFDGKTSEKIALLLNLFTAFIRNLFEEVNRYKRQTKHHQNMRILLQKEIDFRIKRIEERCGVLKIDSDSHRLLLNEIVVLVKKNKEDSCRYENSVDDILHWKALVEVKEMEQKEKQRKYEANYRTLLNKVREHMKGRNIAEKQNSKMQKYYDNLVEENTSLKSQIGLTVTDKGHFDETITHNQLSTVECRSFNEENKLEKAFMKNLSMEMENLEENYVHLRNNKDKLETCLNQAKFQLDDITQEKNLLNSHLQLKIEELEELRAQKKNLEQLYVEKDNVSQKMYLALQNELDQTQDEISVCNREKFFLQRLSSDLKSVLKVHVSQNQVLQEFMRKAAKQKENDSKNHQQLPNLPSPKYNKALVVELIKQHKSSAPVKSFDRINRSLKNLKTNVTTLNEELRQDNLEKV